MSAQIGESSILESLTFLGVSLKPENVNLLAEGIKRNKSLKILTFRECNLKGETLEIFLKGALFHSSLECIDLANNGLTDTSSKHLARIIDCQCERRDQVVWMYGLRNEEPQGNEYTKGLAVLNLSENNFTNKAAEHLAKAIKADNYLRAVNLANNQIDQNGIKQFIYALRKNNSVLNLNFKGNPGYVEDLKRRLTLKLIKNIKNMRSQKLNHEDIAFYSQFIDYSLFEVDIPETVVNWYSEGGSKLSKLNEARKKKRIAESKPKIEEETKQEKIVFNCIDEVKDLVEDTLTTRGNSKQLNKLKKLLEKGENLRLLHFKTVRDNLILRANKLNEDIQVSPSEIPEGEGYVAEKVNDMFVDLEELMNKIETGKAPIGGFRSEDNTENIEEHIERFD